MPRLNRIRAANPVVIALFGAFLAISVVPASAHHSFSMYDAHKLIKMQGTVKAFEWTNPHSIVWLYVDQPSGPPQLWTLEMTSPGALKREGWTRRTLQPGDKITAEFTPLRDGKPGGALKRVTTANGQVLTLEIAGSCRPELN